MFREHLFFVNGEDATWDSVRETYRPNFIVCQDWVLAHSYFLVCVKYRYMAWEFF